MFVHRYRDVDEHVRGECIAAVGRWCNAYPSYFLKDTYLKYIGWSLNDKVSRTCKQHQSPVQALSCRCVKPSMSFVTAEKFTWHPSFWSLFEESMPSFYRALLLKT